jgi:hypothetical protein
MTFNFITKLFLSDFLIGQIGDPLLQSLISLRIIAAIAQLQVTIATNCRAFICCMNVVHFIVERERPSGTSV